MNNRYTVYDKLTGKEVEAKDIEFKASKEKIRVPKEAIMLSQRDFEQLLEMRDKDDKLVFQGNDLRVLFKIIFKLDFENYVGINQKKLASVLRLNPSSVSRSLKKIKKIGVIEESDEESIHTYYRLNPQFGWKGKGETWAIELKKRQVKKEVDYEKEKHEQREIDDILDNAEEVDDSSLYE
ncbi:MAG: hypothetical protein COA94_08075 [Rickettsiales bacterium]|nr:MAG: hypothetical protein COA94_08075 [Rickettsiales bacterium]